VVFTLVVCGNVRHDTFCKGPFPVVVHFDCWVDPTEVIKESNENNNEWSGMVIIPNP